jgi:hypothetical protein
MAGLLAKQSGASTRLTDRDQQIIDSVKRMGVLTRSQLQQLWFSTKSDKACKRRLLKLYSTGVLKRLPRQLVNDPYYYFIGRTPRSLALLEHNLGVNDIRVRVERAVRELNWSLTAWLDPSTLQPLLSTRSNLVPDAYFQIARPVDGSTRQSGLFLEYERTIRPSAVLTNKLTRYADMYHSGYFRQKFGIRGMRVLIVYKSDLTVSSDKRVQLGLQTAKRVGFPLVRFTTTEHINSSSGKDLLLKPIWYKPDEAEPVPLYGLQD